MPKSYLSRLIRKGFRVAVCEQTEKPAEAKKRGYKAVVRREVVRVVTPGTITEDALLDARRHNYLAAVADASENLGLSWLDMSTGAFFVQPVDLSDLDAVLARIEPGELLVPERLNARKEFASIFSEFEDVLAPMPDTCFDSEAGSKQLQSIFGVKALDVFGDCHRAEISAAGAVVAYVQLTQKGKLPSPQLLRRLSGGETMEIDAATRRNLELVQTMSGGRDGSVLSAIDRTLTDRVAAFWRPNWRRHLPMLRLYGGATMPSLGLSMKRVNVRVFAGICAKPRIWSALCHV